MSEMLLEHTEATPAEDGMHQYLQEIRRYPRLTPEQERQLAMGCAAGDEDAIRQMVSSNLRLVVSVAREYAGRGIPLLDLIQEGSIGLLAAAKRFDYTLDYRFSTYATKWIRQGIQRYLLEQDGLIRLPVYTAEQLRKVRFSQSRLQALLEREPTDEELAQHCGLPVDKVNKLLQLPQICSLDAPAGEEDSLQLLLEDLQAPQPQQELVRRELKNTMDALLARLTQRQQQVLKLRFGMDCGECMSFEKIGLQLGISKERARQIEREAMEKLQKMGADLGLEDFLE